MKTAKLLFNKTKNIEIANAVSEAVSFFERNNGLLGRKSLPSGEGLWIKGTALIPCNSIHTFFMRFAIDVVFVDKNLVTKAVYRNLPAWRATWPVMGATSVFELPAGTLDQHPIEIGDQLHVGN